jgi:uncharacterized membrane protein YeaQ/YmgE (transglycosylase-associated protein family)
MVGLIILLIVGLYRGCVSAVADPGRQDIGIAMTLVVGIDGSFGGGSLGYMIFHQNGFFQPCRLIGSIIGAVIVLLIGRRSVALAVGAGEPVCAPGLCAGSKMRNVAPSVGWRLSAPERLPPKCGRVSPGNGVRRNQRLRELIGHATALQPQALQGLRASLIAPPHFR